MRKEISVCILLGLGILLGLSIYRIHFLKIDYNFEQFFPQGEQASLFFEEFRKEFGSDNDYILIAIDHQASIFDSLFLAKVHALSEALSQHDLIHTVQSPTNLYYYRQDPLLGLGQKIPYLHWQSPASYSRDSLNIYQNERLLGNFFAQDAQSITIFLEHQEGLGDQALQKLSQDIEMLIQHFNFEQVHLAGRSFGQVHYVRLLQTEIIFFVLVSILLITALLYYIFRSVFLVLIALITVSAASVYVLAIMQMSGKSINIISNLIPSLLLVVGVSALVHILTHFYEGLKQGLPQNLALFQALRKVCLANLLTALSTGIGFLSLQTSGISPIQEFGLFSAWGVGITFILAYTLLPALIRYFPPLKPQVGGQSLFLQKVLTQLLPWIIRYQRRILFSAGLLFSLSLVGLSQLRVNTFLLEDLRADDPLKASFVFFDEHFAGARSFDMIVALKDNQQSWLDFEALQRLEKVETYLQEVYGVRFMISPLTFLKQIHQSQHGAAPEAYQLPQSEKKFLKAKRQLLRYQQKIPLKKYLSKDEKRLRVRGLMPDLGSQVIAQRNKALKNFMAQSEYHLQMEYHLTGVPTLLDKNTERIAQDIILGLMIALASIALGLMFLFKSKRILLIALIPNILPILMIAGIMGFLGIDLKISTSIIFAIAFGIAVDDTIHFMSALRWELNSGKPRLEALRLTLLGSGKAIIMTTLILSGGFLVFTFSHFLGTFYIGLLISLTLLGALFADLLLLPSLFLLFYPTDSED